MIIKKIVKRVKKWKNNKKIHKNYKQNQIKNIAMASSVIPPYLDLADSCQLLVQDLNGYNIDHVEQYLTNVFTEFPSCKLHNASNTILMNPQDFSEMMRSHGSYIQDLSLITNRPQEEIMNDMRHFWTSRKVVLQPGGVSGVIHRLSNGAFGVASMSGTLQMVGTSHLSGVTGGALVAANPALSIIGIPLLGGVFFAGCERVCHNTPLQPAFAVARDICLIPPKIVEISYNSVIATGLKYAFNIDAPLNLTSILRFGNGTAVVMGKAIHATIENVSAENFVKVIQKVTTRS